MQQPAKYAASVKVKLLIGHLSPRRCPQLRIGPGTCRRSVSSRSRSGRLAGLGQTLPNPNLLIRPFIRREAVLSSRIEGIHADVADLYAYEAGQLPLPELGNPSPETDVREVLNYVHALEHGLGRMATLPLSLRLLRETHEQLMRGVCGEYATPGEFHRTQNWIGVPGSTISTATFVPPPAEDMLPAPYAFEEYLHAANGYPPLVRIGLIHAQFDAIHPFLDGNGRIGRLLIILLMIHWNLLPSPLLYLSAYFEEYRQQYYDLLLAVSQKGTWENWLVFFLNGVAVQAEDAIRRGQRLQDLQRAWRAQLTNARTSTLLLRLVDYLLGNPVITYRQAEQLLGVTYRSARLNIEKLESLGTLRPVQSGRSKFFVAHAIIDAVNSSRA